MVKGRWCKSNSGYINFRKEKAQDRIDKYLFGQMKKSEEKKFLEDLKTNNELIEMTQFTALLCKTLRNRNPRS